MYNNFHDIEYGSFSRNFNGLCTIRQGIPECITSEKHAEIWVGQIILLIVAYLIYYRINN